MGKCRRQDDKTIGIPESLSEQARSIWAKTNLVDPADSGYLQLWQHLEDTAAVSDHIWDDFLPKHVKEILASDLGGEDAAHTVLRFVCGIHDVGKASPAFEMMNSRCATRVQHAGLSIDTDFPGVENRSQIRHELVGYETIRRWLSSRFSADDLSCRGLANIVGGHHGKSIGRSNRACLQHTYGKHLAGLDDQDTCGWQECRFAFLDWMSDATGFSDLIHSSSPEPLPKRAQTLLTAIVIMCDWIASSTYNFPLNESYQDEETFNASSRATHTWQKLNIPQPWTPPKPQNNYDELFAHRFAIPNATLRPVQRAAITVADGMQSPGLMILEANMGEGKTEAALLAAERLAAKFDLGGVYYALPTQATANAMFSRFVTWINSLPADNRPSAASLFLAHGKRDLNDEFTGLRNHINGFFSEHGASSMNDSTDAEMEDWWLATQHHDVGSARTLHATVNSWLSGRKRGNLSDFVVGTIDQILMAGLKSKHVVLRHLALAGKVIILDEVHANTAYMNVFMETVLKWLAYYEVPVIMLSATLPQSRREAYLKAYAEGGTTLKNEHRSITDRTEQSATHVSSSSRVARRRKREKPQPQQQAPQSLDLRYPLISSVNKEGNIQTFSPSPSGRSNTIRLHYCDDSDDALLNLLRQELVDGGCAIVIRNTVSRAQHAYRMIREQLATSLHAEVSLAHSRFLACDRAHIDRDLVRRFGPDDADRPHCAIVVATQVAEQSLDVDFDVMITDIAPVDLILQRAGRLHRHHRGDGECLRPQRVREPHLYITGINEWNANEVPTFDRGMEAVYGRHLLLRSLAVLDLSPRHERTINIPADIPALVQTVYSDDPIGPDSWQADMQQASVQWKDQQSRKEKTACMFRIMSPSQSANDIDGWLETGVLDDPDGYSENARQAKAAVRDSEENVEVVVLQQTSDGLCLPEWADFRSSDPLPNGMGQPSTMQIRDILSCTLSLNRYSVGCSLDAFIEGVERRCTEADAAGERWMEWQASSQLTGQLMLPLDENGCVSIDIPDADNSRHAYNKTMRKKKYTTMTYRYSPEIGWIVLHDD